MIFFHTGSKQKSEQITNLCRNINQESRSLSYGDLSRSLADITGFGKLPALSDGHRSPVLPIMYSMPDVILFYQLSDSDLDTFLAQYKKDGIEAIPLKAIVTPTNIRWTLYELIEQLAKEAATPHM